MSIAHWKTSSQEVENVADFPHHITDPYLPYLSHRWNEGCHKAVQLYEEVVAQGYTGSLRPIEHIVKAFRPQGTNAVSTRTITLQQVPSARSTALMLVRPTEKRTPDQTAFASTALPE